MARSSLPNGTTAVQPPKVAAIYARVSTADQADKGYSLPTQIQGCQELAQAEGYSVPESHIFVDDYTGTSLTRPQFTKLRELVRQALVAAVFVYDLDRLSRKLAHQLLLSEEFEQAGVALRIVTMPEDAKTPEAQLLTNVRGIIAEYERAKTLERTARGRRGRAQAGHVPYGRRTLGYRYVKHADHGEYYDQETQRCGACQQPWGKGACYVIHPEEADLVQRIFRLCVVEGYSVYAIAALLTREGTPTPQDRLRADRGRGVPALPPHAWHPATVASVLHNTTYIGTMYDGKMQRLPGKSNPDKKTRHRRMPQADWIAVSVPPIIDQETFAAAQEQLVRNQRRSPRNRKHEYLLVHGRLRCGQCGSAMSGVTKGGRYHYYGCHRRVFFDATPRHTKRTIRATAIEPIVWQAVERALNNPELIAAEVESQRTGASVQQADLARERQHYSSQLAQCDKDVQRWEAAYLGEAIDLADFKAKKAEVDTRRASVEQALTLLDDRQRLLEQSELQTAALEDLCARLRSAIQHITLEDKRQVLDALDITVTWHPEWPTPKIAGTLSPELFAIVPNAFQCTRHNIPFRLAV